MAIDKVVEVTPMETLILEVMTARYRLGERLWTFESNVARQVNSLAEKGYLHTMNGNVPKTIRAYLTDEAFALLLSFDYVPPIARGNSEFTAAFKGITAEADKLKNKKGVSGEV